MAQEVLGAEYAYRVVLDARPLHDPPVVSVVIPCFNQGAQIGRTLDALAGSMSSIFELIVIDDASTDGTADAVVRRAEHLAKCGNLSRLRVLRLHASRFETGCDALGFSLAEGSYLLEVQADMEVEEVGFDVRMMRALDGFDDLLMLSGRGTEPLGPIAETYRCTQGSVIAYADTLVGYAWSRVRHHIGRYLVHASCRTAKSQEPDEPRWDSIAERVFPAAAAFAGTGEAGRLGMLIDVMPPEGSVPTDRIWLGQTVMRGPLMIDSDRLKRVGGLDEGRFFLGFDDHDLAFRAYRDHGLRCGYLPVAFRSPIDAGTTRKPRSMGTELAIFRQLLAIRSSWRSSALYQAGLGEPRDLPVPELRFLST